MAQISVLVVDDEPMIRMLIQDMLDDLGHTLAGEAARIEDALKLARQAEFDVAILDVDLNGQPIWPVAEVLVARGLPFVFATGYGQRGVPEPYRWTPTAPRRRRRHLSINEICQVRTSVGPIRQTLLLVDLICSS